jgi:aminomethyltransferase
MVPFAGYDMPIQYPKGIVTEHNHTRTKAGLFDVSHMGQVILRGSDVVKKLERLVVADLAEVAKDHIKYSLFTNEAGGILDDLMITNRGDHLYLVVNAACKHSDIAHMQKYLDVTVEEKADWALLALQGPAAAAIMARHIPGIDKMAFMSLIETKLNNWPVRISRSGYTGEDGYEISIANEHAAACAEMLLNDKDVMMIGLGARDTLRLEAGLCLYGHDMNDETTPVEASLNWTVGKRRREEGGFFGSNNILRQMADGGGAIKRVGIKPDGRTIAREMTEIRNEKNEKIGVITSGTFSVTLQAPIAMGYVIKDMAKVGNKVNLMVRDQSVPATIAPMPFVPQRYYRG